MAKLHYASALWVAVQRSIGHELERIKTFIDLMERSVLDEARGLDERASRGGSRDDAEVLYEDFDIYGKHYPQFLRHSTFLMTYAVFDYNLAAICHRFDKPDKTPFNDFKTIQKAPDCLKPEGIDVAAIPTWATVQEFQSLRNWLTHNGTTITTPKRTPVTRRKNRQEALAAVKVLSDYVTLVLGVDSGFIATDHGSDGESGFITMDHSFCGYVVDTVSNFFNTLVREIGRCHERPSGLAAASSRR